MCVVRVVSLIFLPRLVKISLLMPLKVALFHDVDAGRDKQKRIEKKKKLDTEGGDKYNL